MRKARIEELTALTGNAPAFSRKLHVGQPNIGDRAEFLRRVDEILESRWLTNRGPQVRELEEDLSSRLGVKHCITVANATVGLEIAIRALRLAGEVIVPSHTFIATAHALQWLGIKPVFCDVDEVTQTLDPDRVRELITDETSAILGVHLWGRPCAIDELQVLAKDRRLALLFDAAHAFGSTYRQTPIGRFGDAEVFSFHATKFVNSFEGGAITTNSDELANKLRLMTNFGFSGYDTVVEVGTNGKMSEISAAMAITSIESLNLFLEVNTQNYQRYAERLQSNSALSLYQYDLEESNNFQYIVAQYSVDETGLSRDQLVHALWAENVLARKYFWPGCHRMEPYHTLYPDAAHRLPVTERIGDSLIVLPTGTGVQGSDIEIICDLIDLMLAHGPILARHLTSLGVK